MKMENAPVVVKMPVGTGRNGVPMRQKWQKTHFFHKKNATKKSSKKWKLQKVRDWKGCRLALLYL